MKSKSILFLLLLINLSYQTKLQAQVDTLKINFKTKQVTIPKKLNTGDYYYVKIEDVNLNLYKVSIDKFDSSIASSVEFPSFEFAGLEGLNKLLSNLTPLTTFSTAAKELDIDVHKFEVLNSSNQKIKLNTFSKITKTNIRYFTSNF
jgi:hypothetical protein